MAVYWIYLIALIALPLYAQMKVKSTYSKYSKVTSTSGMTGAEVARRILDENGLFNVKVVPHQGLLSDHYNPMTKVVALSEDNYYGHSVAGTAVAAHEVGHAIQDAQNYNFLRVRHMLAKPAAYTSNLSFVFIMIGLIASSMTSMLWIGIAMMAVGVLFQVVTLPVEFDASKRAMDQVVQLGIINNEEEPQAKKVLSAAAMTYVAATAVAVLELVRLILIATNRD
ncbi:Zn-dependent protease [Planococcaceae bacterium Storch 2/2-2]|nr:Zn-dependent protease [Planococcaceae bacterium Storch 2/2-2]